MTKLIWAFLSILAGVLIGLSLTAVFIEKSPNFVLLDAGVWSTRPRVGAIDADPYSKALMAGRGEIPMGATEGLAMTALRDDAGQPLTQACTYQFSGPIPVARYWTLTAYDGKGAIAVDPRSRSSYTSSEIVRLQGNPVVIRLSPDPQPGNWIRLSGSGPLELVLRLYDAQVSTNAYALDAASVPKLTRETCR